jgi:hypothetical protein
MTLQPARPPGKLPCVNVYCPGPDRETTCLERDRATSQRPSDHLGLQQGQNAPAKSLRRASFQVPSSRSYLCPRSTFRIAAMIRTMVYRFKPRSIRWSGRRGYKAAEMIIAGTSGREHGSEFKKSFPTLKRETRAARGDVGSRFLLAIVSPPPSRTTERCTLILSFWSMGFPR